MMILLACNMHGLPTDLMANILIVDWLLDRVDGICKVITDATAVGIICVKNKSNEDNDCRKEVTRT